MGPRHRQLRIGNSVGYLLVSLDENNLGRCGTYNSGWMGERSVPITFADGNSFATLNMSLRNLISKNRIIPNSIAHIPVPVARSRAL